MSKDEPVDAQMVWAGLGPARQAGVLGVHPASSFHRRAAAAGRWIKLDRDRWEAESSSVARCQLSITLVLGIEHGEAEREAAAKRPDYIQLPSQGDARPWPLVLPLLVYKQDGKTCSCSCAGDGVLVVRSIQGPPSLDVDPLLSPCHRKRRHWRRQENKPAKLCDPAGSHLLDQVPRPAHRQIGQGPGIICYTGSGHRHALRARGEGDEKREPKVLV